VAAPVPYGGIPRIADSSTWSALKRASKLGNVPQEWRDALTAGLICTSPVVRLEMLHSAENAADFEVVESFHAKFREVPLTQPACLAAITALRELADVSNGYHRVGLGDALIVASAADALGVGVLHYNHTDFEKLGEVLGVDVVALGPPGTFERGPRRRSFRVRLKRAYRELRK
jgi:predicted nucleic acid-binding protein